MNPDYATSGATNGATSSPNNGTLIGATPVVATQALSKRYKNNFVVNQVNLSVMPGDVFGLLGPNGAGKTTIIRMMLGLVRPSSGRAILFGDDIADNKKAILNKTSAIVEAPSLYPHLSGWDNLKVMAYTAGVTDENKMRQSLAQMGLADRGKDKFQTYSLGMKQRLCIAAALLTDPQLIILDEPTNGLDPAGIQNIRELIKNLASQGRTVFLSSHLLNEVQQVCNRIAIIERGSIIAQGLVEEMVSSHNNLQIKVSQEEMGRTFNLLQQLEFSKNARLAGEYVVVDGAANRGSELNRALTQAGIYPSEIIPRHLSLEEFFLSVTNQGAPPPPPPGYAPYAVQQYPNQPPQGYGQPGIPPNSYPPQPGYGPPPNYPPPGPYGQYNQLGNQLPGQPNNQLNPNQPGPNQMWNQPPANEQDNRKGPDHA